MSDREGWFMDELRRRGVSRREFLGFCTVMTSALALPASLSAKVAKAIQQTEKPILVWLEFQDCCGNTESFLRAARPTVADPAAPDARKRPEEPFPAVRSSRSEDPPSRLPVHRPSGQG
jgi:hydrogenase small subunit